MYHMMTKHVLTSPGWDNGGCSTDTDDLRANCVIEMVAMINQENRDDGGGDLFSF